MRSLPFFAGVILGVCVALNAYADPYFVAGFGESYLRHPGSNKWWIQDGWDHTIKERSNVYRFGFGTTVNKWLSVEANFHDLGTYEHFAGFITEENLYDDTKPNMCDGPCPPTQWGYLHGEVKAVSLSILPTWKVSQDWSLFSRLGIEYYRAKFKAYVTTTDPQSKSWFENDVFSQNGYGMIYGLGITYKQLSFEWTEFPKIHANKMCCSAYQSARTFLLTYRWDL